MPWGAQARGAAEANCEAEAVETNRNRWERSMQTEWRISRCWTRCEWKAVVDEGGVGVGAVLEMLPRACGGVPHPAWRQTAEAAEGAAEEN